MGGFWEDGKKERDLETCIKALQKGDLFFSSYGHLVRDTLFHINSFQSFSFSHTVRHGNVVAHALAQRARYSFPLFVWMESVLSDVDSFVLADCSIS